MCQRKRQELAARDEVAVADELRDWDAVDTALQFLEWRMAAVDAISHTGAVVVTTRGE